QCVVEQKIALETAEPGVPAQEPDAAGGHVVGEIVLGEVDLLMRGDHRHFRLASYPAVVQPLTRVPAGTSAPRSGRRQPDELGDNPCRAVTTSQFEHPPYRRWRGNKCLPWF